MSTCNWLGLETLIMISTENAQQSHGQWYQVVPNHQFWRIKGEALDFGKDGCIKNENHGELLRHLTWSSQKVDKVLIFYTYILWPMSHASPFISLKLGGFRQCWNDINSITKHHHGIYNVDVTFYITNTVWVLDGIFVFDTIHVHIPCKDLHTLVKLHEYQYGLEWYWPK